MKKKNESKVILKQWVQVFIILLLLGILSFAIWAIVKSVNPNGDQGEELYSYNYNSNVDYKVYLKQNEFFTAAYLGPNKQYISSLIDHIDVNFKYNLETTKDLSYTYKYELVATAKGIYAEGEGEAGDVWSKTYPLVPSESKTGTGKNVFVDKTVSIDYNEYNRIMSDFRNSFGLSVDARVDVTFKVEVVGGLPGEESTLKESNTMNLQIPLLKSTTQLKPEFVNNGKQTVYEDISDVPHEIDIPLLSFGVALLLFSVFFLKIFVSMLLKTTKKSEYMLRLNKILKDYADIIAESENLPDLTKYDVVTIKHFNDLVDVEEELHSPIICTEIREDLESWFMIFYDKTAYRYILKYEDLGKIARD